MVDGNEGLERGRAGEPRGRQRVAVLGPGGVGGLLGALLAAHGHEVVCLAGERTARHIASNGLRLRSVMFGDVNAAVRAATALDGPVDVCFVTPKTTQLDAALERVPPAALGDGLVVPFCNGVDHVRVLRQRYPADQVVAATIRVETTRVAPGEIEHTSPFAIVEMAFGGADRARVESLAGLLRDTGLTVNLRDDETTMLWDKLAMLGPLALVTTVAGAPVGEARSRLAGELEAMVSEFAAVAAAEGAELDTDAIMTIFGRIPAPMKTSMLRDAEAHRPTEVEAIGGEVVRAGRRHGIPTPVTARMVETIRERERAWAGQAAGA